MKKTVLREYARLIIRCGANVQKGQEVVINAGLDQPEFVKMVVEECYRCGARKVSVEWNYQPLTKIHVRGRKLSVLGRVEKWEEERLRHYTEIIPCRIYLISEDPDSYTVIHGSGTRFVINDNPSNEGEEKVYTPGQNLDDMPIPLSSKAEMHREQRRIIREQKLAEKKRLREEARAKRAEERRLAKEAARAADAQLTLAEELEALPEDDADLEAEARLSAMLDDQLSSEEEDLMDDLGLDMQEIVRTMAKQARTLPKDDAEKA